MEPQAGDIMQGRIVKHLQWGALVELPGGFVGALRNNEISWSRTRITSDSAFALNSSITVIVHQVYRSKTYGKLYIQLSYRKLQPKPLDIAREKYVEGSIIEGLIVELLEFGAIVEIADGVQGLLHNSEVSWTDKDAKASSQFTVGDIVPVTVRYSYKGKPRLSLSYRETQPDPWQCVEQQYPVGTRTIARVLNHVDYGVFAILPNGCVGLLHRSRMTGDLDVIEGQPISVVIAEINSECRRIAFSIDGEAQ